MYRKVSAPACSFCDYAFAEALCLVFRHVYFVTFSDNEQAIQGPHHTIPHSIHIKDLQLLSVFYIC